MVSLEEVWNHAKSTQKIIPTTVSTELGISLKEAVIQLDRLSEAGKVQWSIGVVCPSCTKVGYTCHYFSELLDEITCVECGTESQASIEKAVVWFENLEPNTGLRNENKMEDTK